MTYKTFNIKPSPKKRWYYRCYISNTNDEMYGLVSKMEEEEVHNDYLAITCPLRKSGTSFCLGRVYFSRESLDIGVIANEMLHCGMWYDRLINKNKWGVYGNGFTKDYSDEERLAVALQYLMLNFTNKHKI